MLARAVIWALCLTIRRIRLLNLVRVRASNDVQLNLLITSGLVKFLAEEPTLGTVGSSSSALELDEEKNRSQSSLSTNSGELRNMTSEQAPLSMSLQLPKLASERGPSFRRGMKR